MSAFVVSNDTINRILYALQLREVQRSLRWRGVSVWPSYTTGEGSDEVLHAADQEYPESGSIVTLGRSMLALNVEAVNARYGERGVKITPPHNGYMYRDSPCSLVEGYKALQCWLYQCSEGNVPETPLFKLMDSVSNDIAHLIVAELSDYKQAAWA